MLAATLARLEPKLDGNDLLGLVYRRQLDGRRADKRNAYNHTVVQGPR
jgi:hypothetical protein